MWAGVACGCCTTCCNTTTTASRLVRSWQEAASPALWVESCGTQGEAVVQSDCCTNRCSAAAAAPAAAAPTPLPAVLGRPLGVSFVYMFSLFTHASLRSLPWGLAVALQPLQRCSSRTNATTAAQQQPHQCNHCSVAAAAPVQPLQHSSSRTSAAPVA